MTATDELRRLLDEREVTYTQTVVTKGVLFTIVTSKEHYFILVRDNDAGIEMWSQYFTPEQAVEATVGLGTCHRRPHINLTIGDNFLKQSGWDCSECGCRLNLPVIARYCPNCGRKVVEDGD